MIQTKNILDSNNIDELKAEIKTLNRLIELIKLDKRTCNSCAYINDLELDTEKLNERFNND